MAEITFTPEEISIIDKHFGFMVFDWAKNLINHILTMAREKGVEVVYMNTPESLAVNAPVSNDEKADYFYEKLPPTLGFHKESADLRGRGDEELWAYRFDNVVSAEINNFLKKIAQQEQKYTLEQLPKKYQGAFLGIIGRKPYYTKNDVAAVLERLKEKEGKEDKGKVGSKFYYDWDSTKWTGAQRFDNKKNETVVLQRLSDDLFNKFSTNPTLVKFMSFLISQGKHFSSDEIGFALVSKINNKIWVINEIQTDCINKYLHIRDKYNPKKEKVEKSKKGVDWETLKDMLRGRNRSKWIEKLEQNEPFKNQVMNDPNIIVSLPDDTQDIDKWIREQRGGAGNLAMQRQLVEQLAQTNFRRRVYNHG